MYFLSTRIRKNPIFHGHPEFKRVYNPNKKEYVSEVIKLRRFLKSDSGHAVGESLKYEFTPFKSFPRGRKSTRCLFILCQDCKGEKLKKVCSFCDSSTHTMNDAVLFFYR
ncbi:MAG: hypothetical protein ABIH08_05835 [Candidatus Omnitrophota bacterium]